MTRSPPARTWRHSCVTFTKTSSSVDPSGRTPRSTGSWRRWRPGSRMQTVGTGTQARTFLPPGTGPSSGALYRRQPSTSRRAADCRSARRGLRDGRIGAFDEAGATGVRRAAGRSGRPSGLPWRQVLQNRASHARQQSDVVRPASMPRIGFAP